MAASAMRCIAALEASGVSTWSRWLRSARRRREVLDGVVEVDGGVALLHPYVDTMCLGSLGTIGSVRPDSSLGSSSLYDVNTLIVYITSPIQL